MSTKNIGKVVQVIGPVLDIRFQDGQLPELLSAIEIQSGDRKIVAEVAQHIGDNVARCISMNATDGMVRGLDAVDTGSPITVPVGDKCLGRIFNLLGQAIDDQPDPENVERWPIHRPAPSYEEQENSVRVEVANRIADALMQVGIECKVETLTYKEARDKLKAGSYDLCLAAFNIDFTPDPGYLLISGNNCNYMRYKSTEMDNLFKTLRAAQEESAL